MVKFLTNSPAEQTRLRDALRAHFPASPQTPPVEAILAADVPYLDASIEELVRVGNIIPEVVREAACDTELLGRRIPKGATVVCSTYVAHRPFDEATVPESARSENSRLNKMGYGAFWQQDMGEYHPERWLRDDGTFDAKAVPKLAFSAGPRGCFGECLPISNEDCWLVRSAAVKLTYHPRTKIRPAAVPHNARCDGAEFRVSANPRGLEQF